ncbi:MAG: type II toxin-antitoxin system RelE/ParE family toxin [Bacteroidota bacterium]|nr:type II toxin-antitoxin system RelE/ParE family toxin [Bacteroidota bacterium]
MKKYLLKINPEALSDIRDIANWYDEQKAGLGSRFQNTVIKQIDLLTEDPQIFAIRYKEIRCMLVKKFPYMIHFYINYQTFTVEILAVISTNRNPKIWQEKSAKN